MKNYELVGMRSIPELETEAELWKHTKSGARLFTMKNQDDNRVFSIAFRTPASDSTGVAHIMEHSVLCGSEKYPLKDPFVELAKGSLNTFLNAMTYPDKTVYPVASTNLKDFDNLMDVYMDAVLHPHCLKERRTFLQEGWHYELEDPAAELRYNGVVYNEMKGVFSTPDAVLERLTLHSLFPDTTYGNESGGDPDEIPALTYEAFCAFHARYYHPSNAYIILYGDLDMEEKLSYLDQEYLSKYDAIDPRSDIGLQKAFSGRRREEGRYAMGENESEERSTYLSYGVVLGDRGTAKRNMAFSILDYALLGAPGAPLKQALLEAGIGEDVYGGFEDGICQPYFSVVAKNAEEQDEGRFLSLIEDTLRRLSKEGLDKKTLLSAINHDEFQYREADYGRTPKGLVYALSAMDSWLYDGKPWEYLECEALYGELRKEVENGYFESLIREYLLDNPHAAVLLVKPEKGLTERKAEELRRELAGKKAALTEAQQEKLAQDTEDLRIFQDTPTPPEDMEKLPMLSRSDIGKKAREYHFTRRDQGQTKILYTDLPSRGILYLRFNFNTAVLAEEELPYAAFLRTALAYMDTEHYSFQDLASEIYLHTGGIHFDMTAYQKTGSYNHYTAYFSVDVKLLYGETAFALGIVDEILHTTRLWDKKRMTEILFEARSRERMRAESASHLYAANRASAYFSGTARYQDLIGGVAYYHFIEQAAAGYQEDPDAFTERLLRVAEKLFRPEQLLLSAGCEAEGYDTLAKALLDWEARYARNARKLSDALSVLSANVPARERMHPAKRDIAKPQILLSGNRNEGFRTPSQVNYVARSGRFDTEALPYTGVLMVLRVILNLEYLWLNLRVKGGAYGCMSHFGRSGEGYLLSYRDPHIRETAAVYEALPSYLRSFDTSEREMTKYVIGAVSELDTPKTNYTLSLLSLSAYLSGISNEMLQKERDQLLSAGVADIRAMAAYVEAVLGQGASCTIGSAAQVEEAAELFSEVKDLYL